jgi:hypothetical protein
MKTWTQIQAATHFPPRAKGAAGLLVTPKGTKTAPIPQFRQTFCMSQLHAWSRSQFQSLPPL